MPLLDHFHPPLSIRRHWESLHATWTVCLADALTALLPDTYIVEPQTHAGASFEIDVATFEQSAGASQTGSATAVAKPRVWTPPEAPLIMPAVFPEGFEVRVFSTKSGPTLVAAIELVSPANKDRPETQRAFATKCASYLYHGISLIVVDVVTERHANLHNLTMQVMDKPAKFLLPEDHSLYAVAYRPLRRHEREEIDLWPERLALGASLPTLPLSVSAELCVPVNLEDTYMDACRRRRILDESVTV